jgi:ActR/RegA family two-component response regulator
VTAATIENSDVARATEPYVEPRLGTALEKVLIAGPADRYCESLKKALIGQGAAVRTCETRAQLKAIVEQWLPDLIVVELRLSDGPTINSIRDIKATYANIRVIVATDYCSIATAVRCTQLGVERYYARQCHPEHVSCYLESRRQPPLKRASAINTHSADSIPEEPLHFERAIWEYLHRVVDSAGSITRGAALLGLDRRSLRRMLGKYAPGP